MDTGGNHFLAHGHPVGKGRDDFPDRFQSAGHGNRSVYMAVAADFGDQCLRGSAVKADPVHLCVSVGSIDMVDPGIHDGDFIFVYGVISGSHHQRQTALCHIQDQEADFRRGAAGNQVMAVQHVVAAAVDEKQVLPGKFRWKGKIQVGGCQDARFAQRFHGVTS